MICYDGIKNKDKLYTLCLSNDSGAKIEIPIDAITASRIALYLTNFDKKAQVINVERGNDEPNE